MAISRDSAGNKSKRPRLAQGADATDEVGAEHLIPAGILSCKNDIQQVAPITRYSQTGFETLPDILDSFRNTERLKELHCR